jgi:DNA replication protein DnaC
VNARACFACDQPATTHAPAEPGGRREYRCCEVHGAEQNAKIVRQQLADLKQGMWRMVGWSFDSYPADDAIGAKAKRDAIEWLDESESSLLIFGPVGSGKSGLAWSIVVEQINRRQGWDDHLFVNVRQLLTRMRRSFGTGDAYDPTDELIEAQTLVLDDLGAERVTDWTREVLATIVEGRYLQDQGTIVTSNFAPSQLARRFDDPIIGKRIVSRLTQDATQIKLDRADLRARREAA